MGADLKNGIHIGELSFKDLKALIEIDGTIAITKKSKLIEKFQIPLDQIEDKTFFDRVKNLLKGKEF